MKAERQKRQQERQRVDRLASMRRQADAAMLPGARVTIKHGRGWALLSRKVSP